MTHLDFTRWRRRRGLTQAQAAALFRKSRWTIVDIESGRRAKLPRWALLALQTEERTAA